MRVAGIVCEYNPFHNGHRYLIEQARKELGADYILCALSSSFLQRGEPALFSKHARAEMAVSCGADIVFEIPQLFSARDAEVYTRAGVAVLSSTNVVTDMVFGCEVNNIQLLKSAANILVNPDENFIKTLKLSLSDGKSLASAKGDALQYFLGKDAEALNNPNASLALLYVYELVRTRSSIVPHTIKRLGEAYGSENGGRLASALGIRKAIMEGDLSSVRESMPEAAFEILMRETEKGFVLSDMAYRAALASALSAQTRQAAALLLDVSEGLENYIYDKLTSMEWKTSRELIEMLKTRRYTLGRLSRFFSGTMLGLTRELAGKAQSVPYLRLLAMRKSAAPLMRAIQSFASVPVITKPASFKPSAEAERLSRLIDARGQDIWSSVIESPLPMGEDYRRSPVIIK